MSTHSLSSHNLFSQNKNKWFARLAAPIAAASLILATGCAGVTNEQIGTVVGGAAGGAAGNQIGDGSGQVVATILGTIIGSQIGSQVGEYMDQQDRARVANTLENNRTGSTNQWSNPDTGNTYAVTPTNTYSSNNAPCREFTMETTVNGQPDTVRGTACRQSDGTWRMQ